MSNTVRYTYTEAEQIFTLPFMELLYKAHTVHKENFDVNTLQASTLLNIKTGNCSEDCSYCSQSAHYTKGQPAPFLSKEEVLANATKAKALGATRFCMGAAGRKPNGDDIEYVCELITIVKDLGMESCVTLGMLSNEQIETLKNAGLNYYNHNIDTSPEFYPNVITTRTFEDRIATINRVHDAGVNVCAGGILGLGETIKDRITMLTILANLPSPPKSVPLNMLIPMPNTPLENNKEVDPFDFIRVVALARILMPTSYVRLSAGREQMEETMQALCFFAGANSVFLGEKLLTASNASPDNDKALLAKLNLKLDTKIA